MAESVQWLRDWTYEVKPQGLNISEKNRMLKIELQLIDKTDQIQ